MRHAIVIAAACAVAALAPGAVWADAVTVTAPFDVTGNGTYLGDFFVSVPNFDTSLGTLTGETLTISGSFTPGREWQAGFGPPGYFPASAPVTLTGHVGIADGTPPPEVTLASEDVLAIRTSNPNSPPGPLYSYTAIGTPESFTVTTTDQGVINPDILASTQAVVVGQAPDWSAFADVMNVQGTATAIYSFVPTAGSTAMPEPASLALLGVGLLGFGTMIRAKRRA